MVLTTTHILEHTIMVNQQSKSLNFRLMHKLKKKVTGDSQDIADGSIRLLLEVVADITEMGWRTLTLEAVLAVMPS